MLVSLMDGRSWGPGPGILRVTSIDTGAGAFKGFSPVAVAHIAADADDHPSGLTVTRTASQVCGRVWKDFGTRPVKLVS